MKTLGKICLLFIALGAVGILALFIWYLSVTAGSNLSPQKLTLTRASVCVYDKNGGLISEISPSGEREAARLCDLPEHLPFAFISVEDKHFFRHHGLEYGRIAKAAVKNVLSRSFREGASTISQQLIKNTHLSGEKTLNRKFKEIKLTRQLEKRYTKEEILELYVNSIYFGHNVFGISNATQFYFGKSPAELAPAESAMLAALVKSPNRYSPFQNEEKCLSRRNFVLKLMKEQGYLTENEYQTAVNTPLPVTPNAEREENGYLSLVCRELYEILPDASAMDMRNLHVYTAYDGQIQEALREIARSAESDYCFVARDNREHTVKAYVSSCGSVQRLPASAIKPLLVYAPAVEEGFLSPATPILDEKVNFGGYSPSNYGGKYGGYMSARYALSHSVNVPAVKILNELGCEKACSYLFRMGMSVPKEDYSLALALGGMREGFTLLQLADGYATLANYGDYTPSRAILSVKNERGRTIYRANKRKTPVFCEETCALLNDMLYTAVKEGTARKLSSLPFPLCAKTGTGANINGNTDAYTLAYTADDTVAVWLGNADNSPIQTTGGGVPADCALRILKSIYRDNTPSPFPVCEGVARVNLDKVAYEKNHRIELADEGAPPVSCVAELFSKRNMPHLKNTRFTHPTIEKPTIFTQNGAICIQLCQTEYYEYVVKRKNGNQETVVYRGKYQKEIIDNSAEIGKIYVYSVQPFYKGRAGETVTLPAIRIETSSQPPSEWWQ